jgi:DNA-binding CsgD family transcriptional regulator
VSAAEATTAVDVTLLERDLETAVFGAALASAAAGTGRVVAVEGEAGIGKTRLLALAAERAVAHGLRVLTARGGQLERQFPFGVVRQLFEPAVAGMAARRRRALLEGPAGRAAAAVGIAAPLADMDAVELLPALHGLYWLCSNLSERQPLLVVVDDAHWADAESLRWAGYVAPRITDLPVALIVAYRLDEPTLVPEALTAVAAGAGTDVLRPEPLGESASAQLVRSLRGARTARAFCRACHTAAAGNPFYVRELAAESEAAGIPPTAAGALRVAAVGPAAIAAATLMRIARLSPACAPLARAVAVLGLDVNIAMAARLAELDLKLAQAAADELANARVLVRGRPLNFRHPVVAAAIYADIAPGARSLLHAQAAHVLADDGAEPEQVAAHLLHVDAAVDRVVLGQLRRAGTQALMRGAPATAATYLRRALEEATNGDRAEVLLELGRAELTAGDSAALGHLLELTHDGVPARVRVDAAVLAVGGLFFAERRVEALDVVTRALDARGGELAPDQLLRLEGARVIPIWDDPTEVAKFDARLPEIVARASRGGVPGRSLLVSAATRKAARGEDAAEVRSLIARGLGDPLPTEVADSLAPGQAISALAFIDELEAADALIDRVVTDAGARGSVLAYLSALAWRGYVALRRGMAAAAETDERAAVALVDAHAIEFARPYVTSFLACALLERGKLAEAGALADALVDTSPDYRSRAGMVLEACGRVRLAQGRRDEAIDHFRTAGRLHEEIGVVNPNILQWRSSLAVALGGESPEARQLVEVELERARALGCASAIGVALRARALVGEPAAAVDTLVEAAAVLERSPARLEYARTLFQLGATLRRAGQRAAARSPLRLALALADELTADALAAEIETELLAAGGRPRRRRLVGADSLTPSERRIVELAGAGRPNREIAQALFLSRKTVEMHLGHAYRKLGISSRAELAEVLSL